MITVERTTNGPNVHPGVVLLSAGIRDVYPGCSSPNNSLREGTLGSLQTCHLHSTETNTPFTESCASIQPHANIQTRDWTTFTVPIPNTIQQSKNACVVASGRPVISILRELRITTTLASRQHWELEGSLYTIPTVSVQESLIKTLISGLTAADHQIGAV